MVFVAMKAFSIRIHEVSPRDGLQNEQAIVSTENKLALIARLVDAGMQDIEVTSFVRPSWIPQLADAAELVDRLPRVDGVRYWGLVPNRVGLERALECGLSHVATFMSASETHNQKNLNRTQRESLHGLRAVIGEARGAGAEVRAYISTVFGCPYEGPVDVERTVRLARALHDAGAGTIVLSDTIGTGHPGQVTDIVAAVHDCGIPIEALALHMHDTRGTAVANVVAGLAAGVRTFDGSIAGVGGCPYAPGAAGNAATEDLVQVLTAMGHETGIDLHAASEAGAFLADVLGQALPGRMHRVHLADKDRKETRSA
jgi:hydroxymethylglutaryl-CoA lyase